MDQQEFVATFREHLAPLSKYLTRRVDRSEVEDLASDVFEIAWRKRHSCPAGMELAWLYRIAGFVVANHRRKQSRRGPSLQLLETDAAAPSAEDLALASSALSLAFDSLSMTDRQILSFIAFEDLSIAEVAVVLGISANSASQRIKRARTRLSKKMSAQLSDDE